MSISRGVEFHERIAENWSAGYRRRGFGSRLELFGSILDQRVTPNERWLDLGCGSGVLTRELLARGAQVVAVDGSAAMLDQARRFLDDSGHDGAVLRRGDVQDLSWAADGSFDGILCSSVIEYLEDPGAVGREAARVLRAGGVFIASVPPPGSLMRLSQKVVRRLSRSFGRERFAYMEFSRCEMSAKSLESWLATSGLELERITPFDPVVPRLFLNFFKPSLLICEARKAS
jgi:ubiquinone/menaquinone biosynthesis C-methylase UbiE